MGPASIDEFHSPLLSKWRHCPVSLMNQMKTNGPLALKANLTEQDKSYAIERQWNDPRG